ncbi:MAG: single-stranded-DNA-specific exonuclease RecJ [Chromatiales bacterium]|jgi:single-stranded-DNA-specific exonuclease
MPASPSIEIRQRDVPDHLSWSDSLHPVLQRIYAARNIRSQQDIELLLSRLHAPQSLLDIDQAADLLADCITQQRHILIIGDFDADGATSTALAMRVLTQMGTKRLSYLVPNRFDFGYGLTPGIVNEALKMSPELIVTVDNGISSIEGVRLTRQHGVKVLVTDHHLQGSELPAADAIVNPNRQGDEFPSKALAGVGVIFYVLIALRQKLRDMDWFTTQQLPEPNLADYLDIVALGTVADVVPLDKNNRILVAEGLKRIRAGKCVPGITALLQVAGRNPAKITASDLGFVVGPRLNAAGRLDDMSVGIECLLADAGQASTFAMQLDHLNRQRRSIEADMQQSAEALLDDLQFDAQEIFGLALYQHSWHQGVIGILASRIKEKIHRPVIAFASGDSGEIKGSARSIPGLHIRDVLEHINTRQPGLIKKFGGHAMAAGLSIDEADFGVFQQLFNSTVAETIDAEYLQNIILTDGELAPQDLNLQLADLLEQAGPWGQAFPEPLFSGSFRVIQQRILKEKHYKLTLTPNNDDSVYVDAIAFNQVDDEMPQLPEQVDLVYRLSVNEFRGNCNLQLMVEKILWQ